jgi:hypothetical protein
MCKHEKISINEIGDWFSHHDRNKNGIWTHYQTPGNYFNYIDVTCDDCGLNRRYYKKRLPKWLKDYLGEVELL